MVAGGPVWWVAVAGGPVWWVVVAGGPVWWEVVAGGPVYCDEQGGTHNYRRSSKGHELYWNVSILRQRQDTVTTQWGAVTAARSLLQFSLRVKLVSQHSLQFSSTAAARLPSALSSQSNLIRPASLTAPNTSLI